MLHHVLRIKRHERSERVLFSRAQPGGQTRAMAEVVALPAYTYVGELQWLRSPTSHFIFGVSSTFHLIERC